MVSQENIDQQHESRGYWVIIWIIVFVFLIITRYALTKVAVKVQIVKDNMRDRLWPVLLWIIVLTILFFGVLFLINFRAKKQDWETKNK